MTVHAALREGYLVLFYAEIDTPILDATVLLSEVLGITKEKLLASLPEEIDANKYTAYRELLDERCAGKPVSYIRHKKEFYGVEFYVDERVLVPRPESELLVEEAISIIRDHVWINAIHDVCTGSGCVAIVIKKYCHNLIVTASDISPECLEVFEDNSQRILGLHLKTHISDLFGDVPGTFDLITANPPYLKDGEVDSLKKIGWSEPEIAFRGGLDGTTIIERLIEDAREKLNPGGYLLIEASPPQMTKLSVLMRTAAYQDVLVKYDLSGRERLIRGRMRTD